MKISVDAARVRKVKNGFVQTFGEGRELTLFSAPGRTEIGGNHTDHQHGRVLAGAVNLDMLAAVAENEEGVIRLQSEGFIKPGSPALQVDFCTARDFSTN